MEASSRTHRPLHLVMLPFAMHGHLIPALVLAHGLDALGFEVTYVCPEYRIQHVKNQARARGCDGGGVQFKSLKGCCPPHILASNATAGEQRSMHDSFDATRWFLETNQDLKDGFMQLVRELKCSSSPPCCIIGDNMLSWAQDVANELNLPRLVMYPSPAQTLAVVFHLKNLVHQGTYPIKLTGPNVQVPGISAAMHPMDLSTPTWDTSPKLFQDFYIRNAFRIHEAAGILCNTFTALEPDACSALLSNRELNPNMVPFLPAGPLLPHQYLTSEPDYKEKLVNEDPSTDSDGRKLVISSKPLACRQMPDNVCLVTPNGATKLQTQVPDDEKLLRWLNKQPSSSVLYVSFGSFPKASSLEQMRELALGVETSNYRFLWVLPAGGEVQLPDDFVFRTQNRGLVVQGWVNQVLVLSHCATGGFLSHCGWNSTLESISRGVPMVMLPQFAEQRGNARLLAEKLKVGVWPTAEQDDFCKSAVCQAVCEVMDARGSFRQRAQELRTEARLAASQRDDEMVDFIAKCIRRA